MRYEWLNNLWSPPLPHSNLEHLAAIGLHLDLSPSSLWQLILAQISAPAYKHESLDSEQNTWPCCFQKQHWSALGLCRSNCEFEITCCCLLRSSKWAELSVNKHRVSWNSRFDLYSTKALLPLFSKKTRPRALFTLVFKEACFYAGADWLSSSVSQKVASGQFTLM